MEEQSIMMRLVEEIQQSVAALGPDIIAAVAILVGGWWIAKALTRLVRRALGRGNVDATLSAFGCNLTYIAAMAFVVISALGQLGISTASFAAVIAAAGLAIGFALQGSLANFAAGVFLIAFRPIKVGEFVEAAGLAGSVQDVQLFATILNTPDNKRITIPNSAVLSGAITNYSRNDTRRIDLVFGIGYEDDIRKARSIIQRIIDGEPRILKDPEPLIAVVELGDNSVNLAVRPWTRTEDYWGVYCTLQEEVKLSFDAEGISIPYPQRDVHLHQAA